MNGDNLSRPEMTTRINFEVPDSVNKVMNNLIPRGVKSDIYRELTQLYIQANKEYGRGFLVKLLDGEARLTVKPETSSVSRHEPNAYAKYPFDNSQ